MECRRQSDPDLLSVHQLKKGVVALPCASPRRRAPTGWVLRQGTIKALCTSIRRSSTVRLRTAHPRSRDALLLFNQPSRSISARQQTFGRAARAMREAMREESARAGGRRECVSQGTSLREPTSGHPPPTASLPCATPLRRPLQRPPPLTRRRFLNGRPPLYLELDGMPGEDWSAESSVPQAAHEFTKDATGVGCVWRGATELVCDYMQTHAHALFATSRSPSRPLHKGHATKDSF